MNPTCHPTPPTAFSTHASKSPPTRHGDPNQVQCPYRGPIKAGSAL